MTRIDSLPAEFSYEADTTRKHLEQLPTDRFEWRPHPKETGLRWHRRRARHSFGLIAAAGRRRLADDRDV